MVYEIDNLYDKVHRAFFSGDNLALNEISNRNYDGNDIAEVLNEISGRLPRVSMHDLQDFLYEPESLGKNCFSHYEFARVDSVGFCNTLAEFLSEGNENAYNDIKTSQINGENLSESPYFLGKVVWTHNNLY